MIAAALGISILCLVVVFLLLAMEDGHDPFPPS